MRDRTIKVIGLDKLTKARIEMLAGEMHLTEAEIVRRAIEILTVARTHARGVEVDLRNQQERKSE